MTTIDGKTRVSLAGWLPEELEDGVHLGTLVVQGSGRTWYRSLYRTPRGFVVFDYTPHDLMPDATVGWLKGYMDKNTVTLQHAEFMDVLQDREVK